MGVFHPFLWVVPGPFQLRFRSFSSGKLWYYLIIPPLFFCLSGTFINQTEDLLNQFCNFLMFPVSPNFIFQPSIVQYCVFNFQEYSFFIASCSSFIDSLPSFIYYKIFLGFLNVSSEFAFSASFGLSVIAFLVAQSVKDQSAMLETACKQETLVQFLCWEDPMEKEMATHSSILGWETPWTEESGGLQSMGL